MEPWITFVVAAFKEILHLNAVPLERMPDALRLEHIINYMLKASLNLAIMVRINYLNK